MKGACDKMALAVASGFRGMRRGEGGPFGACIVRKGRILAMAHNTVLRSQDPTCHAEINAIRQASRRLKRFDLSDCEIYSTTEPCPMCFSAIHWARIRTLYFGTSIADVRRRGFNELSLSNRRMKRLGGSRIQIVSRYARADCLRLLEAWDRLTTKKVY